MAVADFDIGVGPTLAARFQERVGAAGLFILLSLFTLTTFDGDEMGPRLLSALTLLAGAVYFAIPPGSLKFRLGVPASCLLVMTAWGVLQTLFSSHKILVNGWDGVLFWFTAAVIALVGSSVFQRVNLASQFRITLSYFVTGLCVLDLLQQATRTGKYFWLIPSRYNVVFGTFSYWNNFAQFVELSIPITLWHALARSRPNVLFLVLTGVQFCAVVASGSRAGSLLVLLEIVAVILLAYLRLRERRLLLAALGFVLLSAAFVYAAGFSTLMEKLQQGDQIAVRANINKSSIAMLAERPFSGWGLNTYVPVYRQFALYDDGTYVNRAHNDWLQFAVEGGIPFAAIMLAVFIWSIRSALRSGWGVGLIAICLHAVVDYPFARLGVCGWYFALVSMLSYEPKFAPLERDKPTRETMF